MFKVSRRGSSSERGEKLGPDEGFEGLQEGTDVGGGPYEVGPSASQSVGESRVGSMGLG